MKILFLVFSTFILSGISLAQVHHHHHVGSPTIPSKLKSGGQYFEFNSSGLVDYLEYLETSDPKLASAIGGDIKDLRSTDLLASTIKWTSLIGGFVGVSVLLVSDTSDFNSTITTLSVISGLSLAGFYTGWF